MFLPVIPSSYQLHSVFLILSHTFNIVSKIWPAKTWTWANGVSPTIHASWQHQQIEHGLYILCFQGKEYSPPPGKNQGPDSQELKGNWPESTFKILSLLDHQCWGLVLFLFKEFPGVLVHKWWQWFSMANIYCTFTLPGAILNILRVRYTTTPWVRIYFVD